MQQPFYDTLAAALSAASTLALTRTPIPIMPRESHGSGDPCGLVGWVAAGAGTGWKIPTRQKPPLAGKGSQAGEGFFSLPSSHPLRCRRPRSQCKSPLIPSWLTPCQNPSACHGSEQQQRSTDLNSQSTSSRNQQRMTCHVILSDSTHI
jgi:hypothetical protein